MAEQEQVIAAVLHRSTNGTVGQDRVHRGNVRTA